MSEQKIDSGGIECAIQEVKRITMRSEEEVRLAASRILTSSQVPAGASWLVLVFLLLAYFMGKVSEVRKEMGYREIEKILKKVLGSKCNIFVLDFNKDVPYLKEVEEFLEANKVNLERYIKGGIYDCDKFARCLWGWLAMGLLAIKELRPGTKLWARTSFGLSWSQIHMYNMGVFTLEKVDIVRLCEPQNDRLHDPIELLNVRIPCTREKFGTEDFWVPKWEAFSLVNDTTRFLGVRGIDTSKMPSGPVAVEAKVTQALDFSIKLKQDPPLLSARLTEEEKRIYKNKGETNLNPYDTISVMM